MNNKERYQRTFSTLTASRAPEWLKEECMMENNKHRTFRMSRRLIVVCVLLVALLAMSGITYAATGRTIMYNVKLYFSDGTEKDIQVTSVIDEAGEEIVTGNEIDEEFALDENNEGSVRIEGEGWDMEFGFENPEADEANGEETESADEEE